MCVLSLDCFCLEGNMTHAHHVVLCHDNFFYPLTWHRPVKALANGGEEIRDSNTMAIVLNTFTTMRDKKVLLMMPGFVIQGSRYWKYPQNIMIFSCSAHMYVLVMIAVAQSVDKIFILILRSGSFTYGIFPNLMDVKLVPFTLLVYGISLMLGTMTLKINK